ncbi:hypothetical protein D9619_005102 [Psilocybe cf. subviscida]|uniref:Uncharacterized protein n=1 Tax=Psilocybe cf. subviscida TaxID=2480587 RepID=A0A8H5BNU1_9AGAR|nr:hypothetical protein D9619_005102 [Psilocybe cf. subviscida]
MSHVPNQIKRILPSLRRQLSMRPCSIQLLLSLPLTNLPNLRHPPQRRRQIVSTTEARAVAPLAHGLAVGAVRAARVLQHRRVERGAEHALVLRGEVGVVGLRAELDALAQDAADGEGSNAFLRELSVIDPAESAYVGCIPCSLVENNALETREKGGGEVATYMRQKSLELPSLSSIASTLPYDSHKLLMRTRNMPSALATPHNQHKVDTLHSRLHPPSSYPPPSSPRPTSFSLSCP